MAKQNDTKAGTTTAQPPDTPVAEGTRGTAEVEQVEVTATPIGQRTIAQLMGGFVEALLEDPRKLNDCYHALSIWYDAQPVENRKELITQTRKKLESAKLATEALYGQFIIISQRDL